MKPLQFENATDAEMKALNADPGVQSNLHIDRIAHSPVLPTIIETKATDRPVNRSLLELRTENPQRGRLSSEPDVGLQLRHRKPSEVEADKNVPPLIRKDIFYSGSIQNLKEFQSQKSLQAYKSSNASLNRDRRRSGAFAVTQVDQADTAKAESSMVDFSLLKDPVFMVLAVSNLFGEIDLISSDDYN